MHVYLLANKLIHHTQSGDGSQRLFEKSRDQQKNIKAANSNIKSKEKHSGSNEPNLSRSIFAKIDRMFEDKLKENIKVQYSNEACESVGINTNLFNNMSDQWTGLSEKAKEKCAKQVQTLMGDIDEVLMGKSESQQSFPNCSGVVNQNVVSVCEKRLCVAKAHNFRIWQLFTCYPQRPGFTTHRRSPKREDNRLQWISHVCSSPHFYRSTLTTKPFMSWTTKARHFTILLA